MNVRNIEYPTLWSDPINDNIDVFVTLENGKTYCLAAATIEWINEQVVKNGCLPPSVYVIISEFSDDNIKKAVNAYAADDAYWLRLYSVSAGDEIPD